MVVRDISRRRLGLTEMPLLDDKPKTMPEFVKHMVASGILPTPIFEPEPEKPKPMRRKATKKAPVKANGDKPS